VVPRRLELDERAEGIEQDCLRSAQGTGDCGRRGRS
jgi:hypothetical protein